MNSLSDILSQKADDLFPDNNAFSSSEFPASNTPITTEPQTVSPPQTSQEQPSQDTTLQQLRAMIHSMKDQLDAMLRLVNGEQVAHMAAHYPDREITPTGEHIIEGVFNGQKMVGQDGKEYLVPPNYASKSKLVEGDLMKLTITNRGSFIYKQIAPIERKRLMGELLYDDTTHQWSVLAEGKTYKILTASATFYKGKPGDNVVFLVPKDGASAWGAVEHIMPK